MGCVGPEFESRRSHSTSPTDTHSPQQRQPPHPTALTCQWPDNDRPRRQTTGCSHPRTVQPTLTVEAHSPTETRQSLKTPPPGTRVPQQTPVRPLDPSRGARLFGGVKLSNLEIEWQGSYIAVCHSPLLHPSDAGTTLPYLPPLFALLAACSPSSHLPPAENGVSYRNRPSRGGTWPAAVSGAKASPTP